MTIELINISKHFGQEFLFENVNLQFEKKSATAFLGINGSGKSTLLQILATYMLPTNGEVKYSLNGELIKADDIYKYISYCAPYLELIEEMTLLEFFNYHFSFKTPLIPVKEMISYLGLNASADKVIEKFSSGMKQRVKLGQAIFSDSNAVFLDEPCTNLDEGGIKLYDSMITDFCNDKIVVVASNDKNEHFFCKEQFILNQRREAPTKV